MSSNFIELSGLNGSNPLAFLAALGVVRCLGLAGEEIRPRLAWTTQLHPVVDPGTPLSTQALLDVLYRSVTQIAQGGAASLGDIIGVSVADFRHFADPHAPHSEPPSNQTRLLFASAYASDAVVDAKKGTVVPTALSFANGQGGKLLLKDFRTLAGRLTLERLNEALFAPWRYEDQDQPTFRWDPLDMRTGAHMATDPGSTETRSVLAANALAFIGLSFFTAVPMNGELRTTAIHSIDGTPHLVWPLWTCPVGPDVIASLLQQETWPDTTERIARFASKRIMYKKNLYLGGAFAI